MHVLARSANPVFFLAVLSIFLPVLAGPAAAQPASPGDDAGFLGVSVQELTPSLREVLGLEEASGILINQVVEESPAEEAGIQVGDVLIRLNDKVLDSPKTLSQLVGAMRPGDRASVDLIRKGKKRSVDVTIGARPAREKSVALVRTGGAREAYLGVQLHDSGEELARYFHVPAGEGVLVLSVEEGSPAEEAGVRGGDVILSFAGAPTGNSSDLARAVREHRAGEEVPLRLMREGEEREIPVKLAERSAPAWMERPWGNFQQFGHESMRDLDAGFQKQMERLEREMENLKEEIQHLKKR